ncbi:MAG: type II toxin-antitoxin system VapC family toxin, partial [Limisphaerales bacterium]
MDTGPLVAYLNRRDQFHEWARKVWQRLHEPLWTCEAVVSEALFLLRSERMDPEPLLRLVEQALVKVAFSLADHQPDVWRLLRKYADQEMSVADACLVRMAELQTDCQV